MPGLLQPFLPMMTCNIDTVVHVHAWNWACNVHLYACMHAAVDIMYELQDIH